MKTSSLKTRIIIPLTLALAGLLGVFIINVYYSLHKEISDGVRRKLEYMPELFKKQLGSDAELMSTAIEMLSKNQRMQDAWLAKDRSALLAVTSPLLVDLRTKHQVTHLYFHDLDGVNFLRVHQPEMYGDLIDRFTMLEAKRTGQPFAGIELGPLGTTTFRVAHPWYIDDQLVGYIEMGEEIDHLIEELKNIFDVELYVAIHKSFLVREKWESGMQMLGRQVDWDQFPSSVIISQTTKLIPQVMGNFLSVEGHEPMQMASGLKVSMNGRCYRGGFIPFYDTRKVEIGELVVLYDVTNQVSQARNSVLFVGVICVVVGGALFGLFSIILGRVDNELTKHRQHLEKLVHERTAELESEINERKRAEETLQLIVEGTADATGEDFLRSLVKQLSSKVGFRWVFVGEVVQPGADRIRILAVWADGGYGENFEYDLAGTPCENVVKQKFRFYPKNVQRQFPEDHLLVEMGVESYMGIPLVDSVGRTMGVLVALHDKPMDKLLFAKPILTSFAIRTVAEIERQRAEEKLRKAHQGLEMRVKKRTVELAKANQKLQIEIKERKQVEEELFAYQQRLRTLASELSLTEERERRRIAADLHDHIGHNLALSNIKLEELQESASAGLSEPLELIQRLIEQSIHYTESLMFELSPPMLYELGFESAVEWLTEQIQEQHGILSSFEYDGEAKPLNEEIRVLLFRTVRELLVNIVKHAQASRVKVSIRKNSDCILIRVEDNGVGFDPSKIGLYVSKKSGFGLFSIRERLDYLGGRLEIKSQPGQGTHVELVVPVGNNKNV